VWSWVMPWHTSWLTQNNPLEKICAFYDDARVITLENVPSF